MNTPVTHGSGTMLVTARGADAQVGKIAGMLAATTKEQTPLTKQLNTMTLWIGAAALGTMIVMFALGLSRGESADTLFITAIALAIAAIPTALPTVLQVILSAGAKELAGENAIVKDLVSVETLGSTSAINSDKTGTLTMNQMTAVEVVDPVDRYTISGHRLRPRGQGPPRRRDLRRPSTTPILPYIIASDAKLVNGKVVGDPTEGALLVLGHKAGLDIEASREQLPAAGHAAVRPHLQADGDLQLGHRRVRQERGALLREGRGAGRDEPRRDAPASAAPACRGTTTLKQRADDAVTRMEGEGQRVMAAAVRDLDPATFDADGDLLGYVTDLEMASIVAMVDPPREESMAAVHDAQRAGIRVRMVTGDDVTTGAAIAEQLGIPGDGDARDGVRRAERRGAAGPHRRHRRGRTRRPRAQGAARRDAQEEGRRRRHGRRRRERRSGDQGRRHRHRHGHRHAGGQERQPHDPLGRQLRHHRARGRGAAEGLRQPQQVHPLRDPRARGVHHHVPRGQHPQHRRRAAVLARPRSSTSTSWSTRRSASRSAWTRRRRASWTASRGSRDASIMTTGLLTTAGLVGLFMAVCTLALISYGTHHYGSVAVGTSMGVTAFSLMLIAAAFQARSVTGTALTTETFDNRHLNWTALAEFVLAVLITQMDVLRTPVRAPCSCRSRNGRWRWCPPWRSSSSGSSAS